VIERSPLRADLAAFARLAGWEYFPIAFVGRLPFAMMIVGILTVVATVRGSVAEAGIAAAAAGIGTAALGPVMGSLADRFSQRIILIAFGVASIASAAAFLAAVMSNAPLAVLAGIALLAGGTTPQVAPFSRSRLVGFASTPRSEATRSRAVSLVMSYESVMDEASFVLGPVLVGLLTALIAPWAPLAVGALITATVITAFALHHSAAAVPRVTPSRLERGPSAFSAEVAMLAVGMLLVGAVFGSILTALTQFMTVRSMGEQTGILYGAMSAGAIIVSVSIAALPSGFSVPMRWATFAVVGLVGAIALTMASSVLSTGIALFVSGCGVGAVLVSLFTLGSKAAPPGRSTTVLTTLQSAIVVGQAFAAVAGGLLSYARGATAGYLISVAAIVALLALAAIYRWRFGVKD
jgi:MFS family permease